MANQKHIVNINTSTGAQTAELLGDYNISNGLVKLDNNGEIPFDIGSQLLQSRNTRIEKITDWNKGNNGGFFNVLNTINGGLAATKPTTLAASGTLSYLRLDTAGASNGGGQAITYFEGTWIQPDLNSIIQSRCRLSALSILTDEYISRLGMADSLLVGTAINNGVYFLYDRLSYGNNWRCCFAKNGVLNNFDSLVPVTTNRTILRIEIEGTTTAKRYINNNLVYTYTGDLSGMTVDVFDKIDHYKTSGTAHIYFDLDYVYDRFTYPNQNKI